MKSGSHFLRPAVTFDFAKIPLSGSIRRGVFLELKVRVEGQLVFNNAFQLLDAALLPGFGLAYVLEDLAKPYLAKGRLKRVLEEWVPALAGLPPLHPSRRQTSPAFALLVEALRHQG